MLTVHIITNGDKNRINKTIDAIQSYHLSYKIHTIPKHKTNGRLGCFLSHITLYQYAKKHKLQWICISEDNICSANIKEYNTILEDISKVQKSSSCEVLYIGGWITNPFRIYTKTNYSTLYETNSTHGTSFYMIHKQLYERILSSYKKYCTDTTCDHIDNVITLLAKRQYVCCPFLFYRNNQIKTTNLYFSNSISNNLLGSFHYYYRSPIIIRFLQQCAVYWKQFLFLLFIILAIILYFL
jgi:hypothetical protein